MNEEHEYLKRMQAEYGAVIQCYQTDGIHRTQWKIIHNPSWCEEYHYRICPIWLEERLKEAVGEPIPKKEHEFKMGQEYWHISSAGDIDPDQWEEFDVDDCRYDMGNAYHSKEEAQVAHDRQLARVRVERRIKELNGDWKIDFQPLNQRKCFIRFDGVGLYLDYWDSWLVTSGEFTGSDIAIKTVVEEMPEDIMLAMGWGDE